MCYFRGTFLQSVLTNFHHDFDIDPIKIVILILVFNKIFNETVKIAVIKILPKIRRINVPTSTSLTAGVGSNSYLGNTHLNCEFFPGAF